MSLRVRFAPSPTGFLHVGGARTALFNWLLARREGGVFALRIEDTDQERSSPEMVDAILDGLTWLGLDWDEGPVFQSAGIDRHRADAFALLERGVAYRDFSDPEALARLRTEEPARALRYPREVADGLGVAGAEAKAAAGVPHALRFRVPDGETAFEDRVHGITRFRNADIEDLVLLRTDGTPTYNLAVASDDAEMRITHVIRGDDHLSNTPKQILIHEALGRPVPTFAHLPMILGADGKRLSKRHGATAVGEYAHQGILPEAMVNFLALLGWSPGTDEEVLTRAELIERFTLERVLRKSSVFDPRKLDWLNGQHFQRIPDATLLVPVLEELDRSPDESPNPSPERLTSLIGLLKPRVRGVVELTQQCRRYFSESIPYGADAVEAHWAKDPQVAHERLSALRDGFSGVAWEEPSLEAVLRGLAADRGEGAGKLIHPLRVALTGEAVSPGIFQILVALGPDLALPRIDAALDYLERLKDQRS